MTTTPLAPRAARRAAFDMLGTVPCLAVTVCLLAGCAARPASAPSAPYSVSPDAGVPELKAHLDRLELEYEATVERLVAQLSPQRGQEFGPALGPLPDAGGATLGLGDDIEELLLDEGLLNQAIPEEPSLETLFADDPETLNDFAEAYVDAAAMERRLAALEQQEGSIAGQTERLLDAIEERRFSPAVMRWLERAEPDALRRALSWLEAGGFGRGGFGPFRIVDEDRPAGVGPISAELTARELKGVRTLEQLDAEGNGASQYDDLIGKNQILPVSFLSRGDELQTAVGAVGPRLSDEELQLYVDRNEAPPLGGTAFLIADYYVLTNHHVLPRASTAGRRDLYFGYDNDEPGGNWYDNVDRWHLVPSEGYWSDEALDWAIVRCEPATATPKPRAVIPLRTYGPYIPTQRINIIHHPWGHPKRVSVQANRLESIQPAYRLFYRTDTFQGSSGSPLFDNRWNLIGLHSASDPESTVDGAYPYNIGVRIDGIIASIEQKINERDRRAFLAR